MRYLAYHERGKNLAAIPTWDTPHSPTTRQHYRHPLEGDSWHSWGCNYATDVPQLDCCSHCNGMGKPLMPYSVNPYVPDRGPGEVAPTSLYRHFSDDGTLLYVGITEKGMRRQVEHARAHVWFDEVGSIAVQHFDTREAARDAERTATRSEHPLHNIER